MYPRIFLESFWRMELRPKVFVAMSFADVHNSRFEQVIAPAISSLSVDGVTLEPHRVDLSKSGDSILTEIMDGIAHCQLVLGDVSSVGKDPVTGQSYRNGNVMYEVGLALACRQPAEVLLVRDDNDRFLFDVSTIPHMTIDFTDVESGRGALRQALADRLAEQNYVADARVRLALAGLRRVDLRRLGVYDDSTDDWEWPELSENADVLAQLDRLLDKNLIRLRLGRGAADATYELTPLGRAVRRAARNAGGVNQKP